MEPKRILITGANGFVGRHLIDYLLDTYGSDIHITAAVRPEDFGNVSAVPPTAGWSGKEEERITIVSLDISNAVQAKTVVRSADPHQIVNLAGRASGADSDRDAVYAVNVEGTRNLLEAASGQSPFPRVLIVSTGYVYGNTDPERPAREEDPLGPLWKYDPYTDSKIEMENVARNYRGFVLTARAFAHSGPGQSPIFAIPSWARQLARIERGLEKPVIRVGNLEARRDLLDVRDVVRAYDRILNAGVAGEFYNVATGHAFVMRDVLDRLRRVCRVETKVEVDPGRLRPADLACSVGDPLLLRTLTGWAPRYSLDTTLRDTLEYWREVV